MDWPHDPDGDEGSEGGRKYGMAILAKKIEDAEFPLDIAAFEDAVGEHPVRLDHDTVVPASEILEHVDVEQVDSQEFFHRAIGRALRSSGLLTYGPDSPAAA